MQRVVAATSVVAAIVVVSGCGAFERADKSQVPAGVTIAAAAATTVVAPAPTAAALTRTAAAAPTTVAPTTTAAPTTTTPPPTTTIPMPPGVHDPACARVVQPGDSLSLIADGIDDPTVTAESLASENGVSNVDVIHAGDVLDVCPGNHLDDITGQERGVPAAAVGSSGVAAQQTKLNELFAGYGLPSLAVDGVSGPFTRQQLCAARMALHLPISRADMVPGSQEEQVLLSAQSIAIPANAAIGSSRWILINKTCQVIFAGEGDGGVKFVFKTSTGEEGWETTNQESVRAFRYDPALENNGWHNSSKFPVEEDNPLNGNMYRPLYFHRGQAIHGANNVPPEPASKGCARLRPENQDALLNWLGLDDVSEPTHNRDRINVTVSVHGDFAAG
jgi:L,D-transpeptidase catalytic domain/LysM domain